MHSKGMIKEEEVCKWLYFQDKTQCLWEKKNRLFEIDDAIIAKWRQAPSFKDKLNQNITFFDKKVVIKYGKYTVIFVWSGNDFTLNSLY